MLQLTNMIVTPTDDKNYIIEYNDGSVIYLNLDIDGVLIIF